eukprot:CAMPEP_0176400714 /NCGR_PEP_ID=MMETSP0126-20121128/47829_1 /TAXON_ID=141414 ORGANISM="Strombidinopsis acuminatum, Strain SPMC142" /NCGR_SAMPLE_ID=MMETSP0126 /ASSEMBLY_ACC=CAM_ASM_000229 /LENGTH=196 /DNA_ID=CAMNT_0017777157 /DNA_START=1061 /DNA_END=1651 /DNA_ORIENTATION=+
MVKFGPLLAQAYAMMCGGKFVDDTHFAMLEQVHKGDFSLMDMHHHFTSGFKSMFADYGYYGIDKVRINCGGAGFSGWSGLPHIFQEYTANPTHEGDNSVMMIQSSNFLLKLLRGIAKGKPVGDNLSMFKYLNKLPELVNAKCQAQTAEEIGELDQLEEILSVRAAYLILHMLKLEKENPQAKPVATRSVMSSSQWS